MLAIEIPDLLPPAITPDREVVEFLVQQHLQEFGEDRLVARPWQWVLHGGGRGPISHMDCTHFDGDGPPARATVAAESLASESPLHPPTPWDDLKARFICWLCTSQPEDELPLRFHPWDATPAPAAIEEGSVTITMREIWDACRPEWRPSDGCAREPPAQAYGLSRKFTLFLYIRDRCLADSAQSSAEPAVIIRWCMGV